MSSKPLTVAWISDFPVEWMPEAPDPIRHLPKRHPATWMRVLLDEYHAQPDLKVHVFVLRNNVPEDLSFERNRVMFHVLKTVRGLRAPSFFWADTIRLRRALKAIRPDLVHAWGTERGAALVASRLGYPYLVTIQGLLTWYRQLIPFHAHDRFATVLEEVGLRRARFATTEATFSAQYLRNRYPRLTVIQAEHAPHWLFHRIERRPQIDPVRFICVGTLDYRKGSDLLLNALQRLAPELPFELVIIGGSGGAFIEKLRPEFSPAFWQRVQFKMNLPPGEVAREFATATIKVLPTRADTSPNAVKEAVVAGVPVVASNIGGIPDYVYPGQNGILFQSGDLDGLVNALRQALKHRLFSRGLVDPACLSNTRDYLSPERMKQRFFEAYRTALGLPVTGQSSTPIARVIP
jgi:glycosyltransferase involved in cell wall biosynthesis